MVAQISVVAILARCGAGPDRLTPEEFIAGGAGWMAVGDGRGRRDFSVCLSPPIDVSANTFVVSWSIRWLVCPPPPYRAHLLNPLCLNASAHGRSKSEFSPASARTIPQTPNLTPLLSRKSEFEPDDSHHLSLSSHTNLQSPQLCHIMQFLAPKADRLGCLPVRGSCSQTHGLTHLVSRGRIVH